MPQGQSGTPESTRPPGADQAVNVPIRMTLEVLFLESTVLWASSTALLGEEGRLSYSDLMVRAQNIAAVLRRKGMRHGRPGGCGRTAHLQLYQQHSRHSCWRAACMCRSMCTDSPTDKLARQLDESAIRLLVTDRSDSAGMALPWARRVTVIDAATVEREFMPMFREAKLAHRLPEDPAAVIFNAAGHGVLVTHAGIVQLVTTGTFMEFRSTDTVLMHSGAQEHTFQMELWGAAAGRRHGGIGGAELAGSRGRGT